MKNEFIKAFLGQLKDIFYFITELVSIIAVTLCIDSGLILLGLSPISSIIISSIITLILAIAINSILIAIYTKCKKL